MRVSPTAEEIRSADLEATAATESGIYIPSSEGYVQRYDRRGHPQNLASEILREQLRRAQNSVSSTLNDYRHKIGRLGENGNDKLPIDPAMIQAVRSENKVGMLVLFADHCLFFSTDICLVGIRQRLQVSRCSAKYGRFTDCSAQTFHLYAGASLWEVLKFELIHFGLKKLWVAVFLANCLNRTGYLILDVAIFYCDYLARRVFQFFRLRKRGEHVASLSGTSDQMYI